MKLGLALAGGGVKGAAHIGAIKALEEAGFKFDYIAGTSSGSIVASLYASDFWLNIYWKNPHRRTKLWKKVRKIN